MRFDYRFSLRWCRLVKREREEKRWGMQSEVRRFRPKSMQSYCRLVRVYREDILVWKFGKSFRLFADIFRYTFLNSGSFLNTSITSPNPLSFKSLFHRNSCSSCKCTFFSMPSHSPLMVSPSIELSYKFTESLLRSRSFILLKSPISYFS